MEPRIRGRPIAPGSDLGQTGAVLQIVECVMNVSEGRRSLIVGRIADAIRNWPGTRLLDSSSDPDHNRSVLTFVAPPDRILGATHAAVGQAVSLIDLRHHEGVHPRIGAADVVPLVPLQGVTMQECIALARELGQDLSRSFGLPVYLYERAASQPERRNLADIRRGGFEGLAQAIQEDPARKPDFGPNRVHPTAGACAVGARDLMAAFNVFLQSDRVDAAKAIARRIRARNGGLAGVKALGLYLQHRRQAQVSMNLTRLDETRPIQAFRRIRSLAEEMGERAVSSQLIGLIPQAALMPGDAEEMELEDAQRNPILESRLADSL